jgi:Resolvase, N terminal domain
VIAVWKIDRSGRSLKRLANALADLDSLGVAFVSLRNNLDLSTPSGRLMFQVIGAMSKFERSLIQERVRAGLRNAVARGVRLGRPKQNEDAGESLDCGRPALRGVKSRSRWASASAPLSGLFANPSRNHTELPLRTPCK